MSNRKNRTSIFWGFTFQPDKELDFHNLENFTKYDIEKTLKEFIEDSYVAGLSRLLVITGKGKVIKPLVKKLLSQNKYVERFKTAGYYNGQEGAFEVFLINDDL
ncbi:hypothetical protein GF362_07550 [Candidatus Dojkabacteria bacterium]|nr:hypothetical protein [Candidatus Dojkabacteria bacterium]